MWGIGAVRPDQRVKIGKRNLDNTKGNIKEIIKDKEGNVTEVITDKKGNVKEIMTDKDGNTTEIFKEIIVDKDG